ncbi:hypothetical protein [Leclercia sp. LSNIH1]|uniref:hypothetical protein n=1 Tax=Leclercia sp. LSNIH1 TaxID=1920114 RepID=UPI001E39EFC3|nr:hypothetical protein [Leclercia sp. LSNIH1]
MFSAINFLTIHRIEISGIFMILGITTYASSVIYDKLSNEKFVKLCSLFVDKFGARPAEVLIYQDAGFFSLLCVMLSLLKHYILGKIHFIPAEWTMNKFASSKISLISTLIGYE